MTPRPNPRPRAAPRPPPPRPPPGLARGAAAARPLATADASEPTVASVLAAAHQSTAAAPALLTRLHAAARRLGELAAKQVGPWTEYNTYGYMSDREDSSGFYRHMGFTGTPTYNYKPHSGDVYSKISGRPRFAAPF
jgi:hypothetical protein